MTADPKQIGSHLHKETQSARMKRDEEDVRKVMEVFSHWIDPFEASNELASLGFWPCSKRKHQTRFAECQSERNGGSFDVC